MEDAAGLPTRIFDPGLATRHTYLGDVDDLEVFGTTLESGHACCLPLLSLPGVVLGPGTTIPLRLTTRQTSHVARMALTAPREYSCILVVACWNLLTQGHGLVACTAELRQMKEFDDGSINCLAVDVVSASVLAGRQRCRLLKLKGGCKADILILGEDSLSAPPREAQDGSAAWGSWAYKAFDVRWLASRAKVAFVDFAPHVELPEGCPQALSYWLTANMPLHYRTRQELLAMDSTAYRLKRLITLLQSMQQRLTCRKCNLEIGHPRDLLAMSESGSGSVFVNAYGQIWVQGQAFKLESFQLLRKKNETLHVGSAKSLPVGQNQTIEETLLLHSKFLFSGYTHDLVTIKRVHSIDLDGFPQTEHSWFPGYAWTIARCSTCYYQLGWYFSAAEQGLQPSSFWGLRSQAVKQQMENEVHQGMDWTDSDEDY